MKRIAPHEPQARLLSAEDVDRDVASVTRVPEKQGGQPIIRGPGITVSLIACLYKAGATVDEILEGYPHLHASWVHDAIGYYLDHLDEIECEIRESRMEYLAGQHDLTIDERGFVPVPRAGRCAWTMLT